MLYAATRNKSDIETAYKAIHQDSASDGGLFVPFRIPQYTVQEILELSKHSFGENVANILNIFFSAGLTALDIDFTIGRTPVQMNAISHRILIAECWHNSQWHFKYLMQCLSDRIRTEDKGAEPTNWVQIAIRIAVLFGIYGNLLKDGKVDVNTPLDVCVTAADFSAPMAAWYARSMGLPIGTIICGCNANGGAWDLLHRGEFSTAMTSVKTCTPDADIALPRNLERLICATLGHDETQRYLDCCSNGAVFTLGEEHFESLRSGLFVSVISDDRVQSSTFNVFRTSGYVFGPYSALAYSSLQDYRAKTGESRTALLFTEKSPGCNVELVAKFMQVDVPEVFRRISGR